MVICQTNRAAFSFFVGMVALCFLALGLRAASVDVSVAFDEANRLYEQGRFGAAADAYESLLQAGQTTPAVLHNLGNARFRNGEIGRSIQAFLQAERLAPRDSGIQSNLQFARRAVKGAEESSVSWPRRVVGRLSGNEWAWLVSGCGWLFFLLLAAREWRPALRSRVRPWLQTSGVGLVIAVAGFWVVSESESRAIGVVVVKEAPVRFTPLDESPVSFAAVDGLELVILGHKPGVSGQGEWVEVRDAAQRSGWIKRGALGLVTEEPVTTGPSR
jgi:hypothetical protein